MAKIPTYTAIPSVAAGDLFYGVDVSDTTDDATGSSRKVTASQLATYVASTITRSSLSTLRFLNLGTAAPGATTIQSASTTEGSCFGGSISITGGTLTANDVIYIDACGTLVANTGCTLVWKLKFGSTTLLQTSATTPGTASLNAKAWRFQGTIGIVSSSSQVASGILFISNDQNSTTWPLIPNTGASNAGALGTAVSSEDTSSSKSLDLTVTMGGTVTSCVTTRHMHSVYLRGTS